MPILIAGTWSNQPRIEAQRLRHRGCFLFMLFSGYSLLSHKNVGSAPAPVGANSSVLSSSHDFSLIELLVVLFLISLMLFFAFPRLSGFFPHGDRDKTARWIVSQAATLKTRAVKDKKTYILRVDLDANTLTARAAGFANSGGVTPLEEGAGLSSELFESQLSDEQSLAGASLGSRANKTLKLADELVISDVMLADGVVITSGLVDIRFYKKGYSDRAIIHMREGEEQVSFYIAPFLSKVNISDGYAQLAGDYLHE